MRVRRGTLHALAEAAVVVAAFLALASAYSWPLAGRLSRAIAGDAGDPVLNMWTLGWVADRLRHGLAGFWDAPFFFPYSRTLAYSEHLLGIGIFTSPLDWLTGDPILVYNLAWLGSFVLAGAAMYGLARELTGRRDAASLAGLAFAFTPYRIEQVSHLQVLTSGWMPLALWGLHRYARTRSRWALAGFVAAFTLNGLSNGYFLLFFAIPVALAWAFALARHRPPIARTLAELTVAAAVIAACLWPVAAVYQELRSQGFTRTRGDAELYGANVADYAHASGRLWLWGGRLPSASEERNLFPGVTVTVLAAAGIVLAMGRHRIADTARTTRADIALYVAIAAVGFVLSLGPVPMLGSLELTRFGPYEWLRVVVPGWDGLRVPARMATIVYLALGVLAAYGAARLLSRLSGAARAAATVVLGGAVMVEGFGQVPVEAFPRWDNPNDRGIYLWLRDEPPGAVLELPAFDFFDPKTLRYQLNTLMHGHRIVNGYSGYRSALQGLFAAPVFSPPDLADEIRMIRAAGVRYVVFHGAGYDEPFRREIARGLRVEHPDVETRLTFGDTIALRLRAWGEPPPGRLRGPRVPADAIHATASQLSERLPMLFDGVFETRWHSNGAQQGLEWIALDFDRPREIAGVRLETDSLGDFPRRLVVEGRPVDLTGDAFPLSLYEGSVLTQLAQGVLSEPDRLPVEIAWPPVALSGLRLRQTGTATPWQWAIHELIVVERAP
jgi:hypothetical protein